MDFTIDRDLPISIRQQLKGLIEYSIVCGDLAVGEALPSVRDLAARLGVAPMTISQIYADLKSLGLIETRTGAGTRVADSGRARAAAGPDLLTLHARIDALIDEGMALGMRASDLASLINARLVSRSRLGRRASVAMVGLFPAATARYARLIAKRLGPNATVEAVTIDAIQRDRAVQARAASADLVVTLVNRHREVASSLPGARVVSIRFIPSDETRAALAAIAPTARVLLTARFPEFLPIMKMGVVRFAPHLKRLRSAGNDAGETAGLLADSDVVVFASGTDAILQNLDPAIIAIEYSHVPDPIDIDRVVVPVISGL